ncbi:site-specific DNA-methyltransferase [Clostridia bacterium]|jgi:adenine-specific DNA-methyltransferase|nr:site-specific DNA-methyltransferase [Clostridia bacterium]
MDKMKFETPNLTAENVTKIAELFPGVVTEGKVNFDLLRSMLGEDVYGDEAYEFTWVGKRAAIAEAGRPIRKTLRPCVEESKDWDTTENLYIEGDNLDVLKLLQESYLGKVKMIYIDPPYNTGSDSFLYPDNYRADDDEYEEAVDMFDESGQRNFRENTISNPRMHSDWCSMIYSRLRIARDLLTEDGAIFVSIDEHEHSTLKAMMDEIFGEANYVDSVVWDKKSSAKGVPPRNMMVNVHEYIVVYQRSDKFSFIGEERNEETDGFKNPDNDPRGPWRESNIKSTTKPIEDSFTITDPNTGREYTNTWAFSKESLERMIQENRILWKDTLPKQKEFMREMTNENKAIKSNWGVFDAQSTTVYLKKLITEVKFDNPKPLNLMKYLLKVVVKGNDIVFDFFSGSGTTGDALMQLNAEDGGKRKFIMVQLPEVTDEKSEAYKAGYKNICEIGKERIRRAGDKIKAEAGLTALNLDIGFRVLKLDDTNMNDVYYAAGDYTQDLILQMESNIKPDRTDMDLLYGCLLEWGLPLSMPHTHEKIDGFTVHTYNDGDLIACFEDRISEKAIREIASRKPLRAVFRDSSFSSSPEKINVFEIFKLLAPNTNVRVI